MQFPPIAMKSARIHVGNPRDSTLWMDRPQTSQVPPPMTTAKDASMVNGMPEAVAASFLRLSFGPDTSEAEVDAFLAEFGRIATRLRASRAA